MLLDDGANERELGPFHSFRFVSTQSPELWNCYLNVADIQAMNELGETTYQESQRRYRAFADLLREHCADRERFDEIHLSFKCDSDV